MPTLREYLDESGRSPFARWLDDLATPAALKVRTALARLEAGNTSALKSVGGGVHELRIDFGPGYRIYLGLDGAELVILLGAAPKHDKALQSPMCESDGLTIGAASARVNRRPADATDQRFS
jgi:putative addiction module killer protein